MPNLTIIDIARLANVSTATVSRVIRNPGVVRQATRDRVLAIIEERKYIYNALAGDLSKKRSTLLSVYVPTVESAKLSETIFALQETVQSHGYPVIVNNTSYNPRLERDQLRQARERSLSGVFLIGYMNENLSYIDELINGGIPAIFLWDVLPGTAYSYVGFDNNEATYNMTSYLIGLGHKKIAFVGAMQSKVERVRKRFEGYLRAMDTHGLPVSDDYVKEAQPTLENGFRVMESLLDMEAGKRLPTAVFFASDMLALGAMDACRQRGLAIPERMSVAGFDNIEFSNYIRPSLTTIYVPSREIGQFAGQFLMNVIDNNGEFKPQQLCLETSLILRESCGAPRKS
jgi:DNA-binding LacI/PurR family transcriptional regulator